MSKQQRATGPAHAMHIRTAAATILVLLTGGAVQASSSCDVTDPMPAVAVEALARNPMALLRRHADADVGLAQEAQSTMASGEPGRFSLITAAQQGTAAQQEQIGRGIGRAYRQCLLTNRSAAQEILNRMLRSDLSRLTAAFQAEVDSAWTQEAKPQLHAERPADESGGSPTDVLDGGMPSNDLTARIGPYSLPPLSGPLLDPFAPIR